MRVDIRLFAAARQLAGASLVHIELPTGATVRELKTQLQNDYPSLGPLLPRIRCAINDEYVDDPSVIPVGAEVAVIPPVSGGLGH